jgi:hypothetical protein
MLTWTGLEELRAQLRELPAELAVEAGHEVETAANGAAATVKAVYAQHRVTGELRDAVTVEHRAASAFGAAMVVRVNSPIAWLFDNGSMARHYVTASGTKHRTGAMWGKTAPTHVFVTTVIAARRRMYAQLKALLVRKGLTVTGDAG